MSALFYFLRRVAATLVVGAVGCALLGWMVTRAARDLRAEGEFGKLHALFGGVLAAHATRPALHAAQPTSSSYAAAQISDAAFGASDLLPGSHVAPVGKDTSLPLVVSDNYLVLTEELDADAVLNAGDLVVAEGGVRGVGAVVAAEAGEVVISVGGHELRVARQDLTRRVFGFLAARPNAPRPISLLYPPKK